MEFQLYSRGVIQEFGRERPICEWIPPYADAGFCDGTMIAKRALLSRPGIRKDLRRAYSRP
ncbi:MAG: hypothetical protein JO015_11040 [Verrucomicrobia bacterium]|nr:hypothetical protein [Verrucomicrobiota bacterium]